MIEKNGYIIVEKGDTLSAISSKVGMSTNALQQANPAIKDINKIYVKQKIKTKPKEEEKPKEKAKAPKETAQEVHEEIKDEPVKNSEAAECCCMLQDWTIEEKGRTPFKLEVVKDEKWVKINYGDIQHYRAEKLAHRKRANISTLYVVTSPADSNGNVTYKEITTNHIFKKKNCDLKILAKKGKQEKYLTEGEVLKIDSNGDIIEQKHKKADGYIAPTPNYPPVKVPVPDGYRIKAYRDQLKPFSIPIFEDIPIAKYPIDITVPMKIGQRVSGYREVSHFDVHTSVPIPSTYMRSEPIYEDIPQPKYEVREYTIPDGQQVKEFQNIEPNFWSIVVEKYIFKHESYPIFEKIPSGETQWDVNKLINLLFDPIATTESILLSPTGSSKCPKDKIVELRVSEPLKIKGAVALSFTPESLTGLKADSGGGKHTKEINNKSVTAEGVLEITHGSHVYAYKNSLTLGGGKRDISNRGITEYNSGKLFKGGPRLASKIYDITAWLNKSPVGYKSNFEFTPGATKFELKVDELTLVEDPESAGLVWDGSLSLGIGLFDGAEGKLDLIPYITGVGGVIANLISTVLANKATRKAQAKSEKERPGNLELILTVSGKVAGEIKLTANATAKSITVEGAIGGDITFKLTGKISGGINAFGVTAMLGASLVGASAKTADDGFGIKAELKISQELKQNISEYKEQKSPKFDGDLICTGCAIYYAIWSEIVYEFDSASGDNGGKGDGENVPIELKREFKAEDKIPLIDEFSLLESWFGKEKKTEKKSTTTQSKYHASGVPMWLMH